jgi:hypothetical protein
MHESADPCKVKFSLVLCVGMSSKTEYGHLKHLLNLIVIRLAFFFLKQILIVSVQVMLNFKYPEVHKF